MPGRWCIWTIAVFLGLGLGSVEASGYKNETTVAVNIAESIAVVAWPDGFLNLATNAMPGDVIISPPLSLTVKANSTWGVEISCDVADGRMQEFDPGLGAYVPDGRVVTEPLEWSTSPSGPWQPLSTSPRPLVATQAATGDGGAEVGFYLRFAASYGDMPAKMGREYRITMHYTAGLSY
ncbi:MAG: hypothetical protein GX986_12360 [Firmicutes bacterium]|nr:hypothetical protein [Bacillota bacterium]